MIGRQRVAAGLALHGALARPASRSCRASVVTLAAACMLTSTCWPRPGDIACEHRGERGHHREVLAGVHRLVAAAADRRQRVVVVAAAPDRPAAGEQREVGGRFVRACARRGRTGVTDTQISSGCAGAQRRGGRGRARRARPGASASSTTSAAPTSVRNCAAPVGVVRSMTTPRFDVL